MGAVLGGSGCPFSGLLLLPTTLLSGIGGVERPGIVHRLDRETSGAMVIAKTDAAHRKLAEQFAERTVQKEYLALVSGVPPLLSGSIKKPIGRNQHQRHKMNAYEIGQGWNADSEGADFRVHFRSDEKKFLSLMNTDMFTAMTK